jgi:uncharacterized FlaG/YvyC family protein
MGSKKIRQGGLIIPGERKDPMNENEVAKVGAVGSEPVKPFQFESSAAKAQPSKQSQSVVESPRQPFTPNLGEIRLSFRVDGSNKDVTITVTDKESGRVIRTIPFDAMKDLSIGELFQVST